MAVKEIVRVLHVITDTNIGGAGKLVLALLSEKAAEAAVALPKGSLLADEVRRLGVKCCEAEGIAEKSMSFRGISAVYDVIRDFCPDVVHAHASISARIAAKRYSFRKKCAVVSTRHSVFPVSRRKGSFPFKQINGLVNGFLSDVIIAVSPAAKQNLIDEGTSPEKIEVIFNGVSPPPVLNGEERADIRRRLGVNAEDFVCAVIARLEQPKGHEYIIEAAKMLPPEVKVIIAGAGSLEDEITSKIKDSGNIIFTGFVKKIEELENIMDVQLNASVGTEATSLSLLEGMALGIPAVVSDFGGNPYVIENGQNGIVVPQRDPEKIAEAVLRLYGDKGEYQKMSQCAKRIFEEKFTVRAMCENTFRLYGRLTGK